MKEDIQTIAGITQAQVGMGDDGIKLYLDRMDGAGVAIELTQDQFEALERTFMLVDPEHAKKTGDE